MQEAKEICSLTKEELTNPAFLPSIFENYTDIDERNSIIKQLLVQANDLKVLTKFKKDLSRLQKTIGQTEEVAGVSILLTTTDGMTTEATVDNYTTIMQNDEKLQNSFYYDEFNCNFMHRDENGNVRLWSDADDSILRAYIEKQYGIYNQQKYYDSFNKVMMQRRVHPIKDIIESATWDGKPRIDRFLTDIMGCDDDVYSREVSRMIFYAGIERLYHPGKKFDYMPILVGVQGSGKSTIIEWLALENRYYRDIYTIEGKEGMEILNGAWICEMAELLAMVRTKDVEAMKGYITRTSDKYRKSYDKRISEQPRQCIFIGTTNDYQFLIDKTGNRRYLPIEVHVKVGEIYRNEKNIKKYILQCWREALHLMRQNKTYTHISGEYADIVKNHQESVLEDDPKVGLITDYLNKQEVGKKLCGLEIFTQCLNNLKKNYNKLEGKEISKIMQSQDNWKRCDKPIRFDEYGVQRYWEKLEQPQNRLDRTIGVFDVTDLP